MNSVKYKNTTFSCCGLKKQDVESCLPIWLDLDLARRMLFDRHSIKMQKSFPPSIWIASHREDVAGLRR